MFCVPCRSLVRPLTVRKRKVMTRKMEMDHLRTLSPTPPLPPRNPNRRFSQYQQPLLPMLDDSSSDFDVELIPRPLFSPRRMSLPAKASARVDASSHIPSKPTPTRRITLPPSAIHTTSLTPYTSSRPYSSATSSSATASKRSSYASATSSRTSTPATSASNSPTSRPQSLAYSVSPATWAFVAPEPTPTPSLRRKKSPRKETLRSMSSKELVPRVHHVSDQRMFASQKVGLAFGGW